MDDSGTLTESRHHSISARRVSYQPSSRRSTVRCSKAPCEGAVRRRCWKALLEGAVGRRCPAAYRAVSTLTPVCAFAAEILAAHARNSPVVNASNARCKNSFLSNFIAAERRKWREEGYYIKTIQRPRSSTRRAAHDVGSRTRSGVEIAPAMVPSPRWPETPNPQQ